MDISIKAPGWEKFVWEDVECEIKTLTFEEGLDVPPTVKEQVKSYVRNIKGLKVNGKEIKKIDDLMDPKVARCAELQDFYLAILEKYIELNSVTREESKNSSSPPEEHKTQK